MIHKTLNFAQVLGDHLAQGKLPPRDLLAGPAHTSDYVYLQLKPLKDIEHAIALWQGLLRNFVNIKQPIQLIVTGNRSSIRLILGVPTQLQDYIENIYYANFSTSEIAPTQYHLPSKRRYINFGDEEISLDADFVKNGQYIDPFKDILSSFEIVGNDERLDVIYQCVFKKSSSTLGKIWKLTKQVVLPSKEEVKSDDVTKSVFDGQDATQQVEMKLGYHYQATSESNKSKLESTLKSVYLKYVKGGSLKISNSVPYKPMRLNQFVNFYHFMTKEYIIPNLDYAQYRKLPAPTNIATLNNIENKNDLTVLGYTDYKSDAKMFGIKRDDKLRHMYIVGQTGTGKSKFIANMVRSDMISNKGVCVIDPHGDLIDDILSQVPSYRINDVVLFDVADRDFPVGFNVFEYEREEDKPLIASGILGIFKKMFDHSWGPRLEYILRNVIFSLLEYPGATFLDLIRMLTDDNYREEVLSYVKDPIILKFWRNEFDKYQPRQREEAVAPITNKVGQFTSSSIVRNIFGQSKTKLNFRKMMDEGKIILVNLSKGKVGDDSMAMIGSFIASKIQIDAMSRADIPESQRRDFYLYIDEFQNFATESFATILSEARKYKLALIMANQYTSQIDQVIRDAIFGNVGTLICNRIAKDDAEVMAGQFKGIAQVNDFLSLPNRKCYIRLMVDGMVSDPFSMSTADFVAHEDVDIVKAKVREQSRQRYAMPRAELEALMKAWAEKKFTLAEKVMEKAKAEAKAAKEKLVQQDKSPDKFPDKSEKGSERSEKIIKGNEVPSTKEKEIIISSISNVPEFAGIVVDNNGQGQPEVMDISQITQGSNDVSQENNNDQKIIVAGDALDSRSFTSSGGQKRREQAPSDYQTSWSPDLSIIQSKDKNKDQEDVVDIKIQETTQIVISPEEEQDADDLRVITDVDVVKPVVVSTASADVVADTSSSDEFLVEDLIVGQQYQGYVKLKYNYGMFVTVYGVEGLLHKNFVSTPEGVSWKKIYEIGDPIQVTAMEFKEIGGERRVVWTQI